MSQDWETVEVTTTSTEADLVTGFLESHGITVEKESRIFTQEPVSLGTLGDVQIRVPAEQAEEARELLATLQEAPEEAPDEAGAEPSDPDTD